MEEDPKDKSKVDAEEMQMTGAEPDSTSSKETKNPTVIRREINLGPDIEAHFLAWRWSYFQIHIVNPHIPEIVPPVIHHPEKLVDGEGIEFVYPIFDYGFILSASKGEDMVSAGMSMCKLFYTVEKMVFLLTERLKTGGISTDTEVEVAFAGYIAAQRKGFESIINLGYNVVVTNFDPGSWGEKFLTIVKNLADKGYGYPAESPRDIYRHIPPSQTSIARKP